MDKYSLREVVALIIWWGEGTKSRRDKRWKNAVTYPVEVTNTNPDIIKIFLDFLRNDMEVKNKRIYLQLQIHEGDNQTDLENYWAEQTGILKSNFQKTIVRPKGNKVGKSNGTCKVRFADKELHLKLKKKLDRIVEDTLNA